MAQTTFTLRKPEKLRHKRLVGDLFAEGNSLYDFPLRLVWRLIDEETLRSSFRAEIPPQLGELQMLITVPKKKRRHAVDRVLMRRRIREAYRLNRLPLKETVLNLPGVGTLSLAFIYLCDQNLPYSTIEKKMRRLLAKVSDKLSVRSGKWEVRSEK
ncbi:MAG: ribonuclease P protein component [Muribaculaceae bacterium]|nr:ribonuclease P protein component [Muribaculaceae bacterium]